MADREAIQRERDAQADIAQAVKETEEGIFADALGGEEPDREDTSLEGMDENRLEGDETIDDDIDEAPESGSQTQAEPQGAPELEESVAETDPRDQQIAELRAQIDALSQRISPQPQFQPQPQQFQPQPGPMAQPQWQPQQPQQQLDPYRNPYDSVLEPEKFYQHSVQVMQQIAAQTQRASEEARVNALMEQTQRGPRGTEFQQAYQHLVGMPPDQRLPIANQLRYAQHPGEALLEWWETTPEAQRFAQAEEARMTEFLQQRGYQVRPTSGQRQQAPAASRGRIPPSLNAIPGGRSHRASDDNNRLQMGDSVDGLSLGDDSAIFANVWRNS